MDKAVRCRNIGQMLVLQILFVVCGFAAGCKLSQHAGKNVANDALPLPLNDSISADSLALQNEFSDSTFSDSLSLQNEFLDSLSADSLLFSDSIQTDSLILQDEFSEPIPEVKTMRLSPNAVETIVDYFAEDSVEFDIMNRQTLLFNNTKLLYEDIELTSHYVTIDFSKSELHAEGFVDSNEILQGKPVFKQGEYEFKCHELDYNFTSKKGLIRNVITQEGEGYLHGELVKKNADNSSFIRHGKYTTCNLECPHFEIDFGKAKVIPGEKIITGPLHVRIANIPTFFALPFGLFPNSNKRTNGLLIGNKRSTTGTGKGGITYNNVFGYYLDGIGYYFAIKDRIDFAITADIYMQRAFGLQVVSNYVKRYKYNSSFDIKYQCMPNGEPTTDSFRMSNNVMLVWRHSQDRKAHPRNNFSANVDFQTSGFKKNTPSMDYDKATQSVTQSSVSFSTSFKSRYSLGINANMSQNLNSGDLNLDLPQVKFSVQQFYPLRKKKRAGKLRWYEEISMQYSVDMRNGLRTNDSILFNDTTFKDALKNFNSELNHSIPIKSTIKLFKHISWNNTITANELWRMKAVYQSWEYDSTVYTTRKDSLQTIDTIFRGHINRDTNYGFFTAHNLAYNSELSTTLYGMYIMKKGRVYALRHSLTPSVSFRYQPGILNQRVQQSYYDSTKMQEATYWLVGGAYQTSASINFGLNNKLEMKVRKKKKDEEEEEEFKKVMLLESFSIRTSYDFMRDSLRLEPISINGRTLIFKQIDLSFGLRLDPYSYNDSIGERTNVTEWKANHRLFRVSSTAWDVSFSLNLNRKFFTSKKKENTRETTAYGFKDWNMSLTYSFRYNMDDNRDYYRHTVRDTVVLKYTHQFTNTLNFGGRLPLTSKWSIDFRSGYDFSSKRISYSDIGIERDLHCWKMSFRWIQPFASSRTFEFSFQAKANILKDISPPIRRDIVD